MPVEILLLGESSESLDRLSDWLRTTGYRWRRLQVTEIAELSPSQHRRLIIVDPADRRTVELLGEQSAEPADSVLFTGPARDDVPDIGAETLPPLQDAHELGRFLDDLLTPAQPIRLGLARLDADGRLISVNPYLGRLLELPADTEQAPRDFAALFQQPERLGELLAELRRCGTLSNRRETFRTPEGATRELLLSGIAGTDEDGRFSYIDISLKEPATDQPDPAAALRRVMRRLNTAAPTGELTELLGVFGEGAGLDRLSVYRCPVTAEPARAALEAAWSAAAFADHSLERELPLELLGLRKWHERLRGGEALHAVVDELARAPRKLFARRGAQSIALCPLFVPLVDYSAHVTGGTNGNGRRLWGVLLTEDLGRIKRRDNGERACLEAFGGLLSQHLGQLELRRSLDEAGNCLRNFYVNTPVAYQSLDPRGRVLVVNEIWRRTLGYSAEEVVGRSFADFLPPADAERFAENFARFLELGEVHDIEYELRRRDGSTLTVSYDGRLERDKDGVPRRTHCTFVDISRRKAEERAVLDSEQYFHSLADNLREGLLIYDRRRHRVVYLNPAVGELCGRETEYFLGKDLAAIVGEFVHEEDRPRVTDELRRIIELRRQGGGATLDIEYRLRRADGEVRWVRQRSYPRSAAEEEHSYLLLSDITDSKLRRRELVMSERILAAVSHTAEVLLQPGNLERDLDEVLAVLGEAAGINRCYLFENHTSFDGRQLSTQRHEWTTPDIEAQLDNPELQDFDYRAVGFGRWIELMERGEAVYGPVDELPATEAEFLAAQDIRSIVVVPVYVGEDWWGFIGFDDCTERRRWSSAEIEALRSAAGIIGQAVQRDRMERAVAHSRERYRKLFNSNQDAVYVFHVDDDGRPGNMTDVNDVACERLGYSREELLGLSLAEIDSPAGSERAPKIMERLFTEGSVLFEGEHVTRDGRLIPVEINAQLIELQGRKTVLSTARDISERLAYERALEKSEREYRTLVDNANEAVVVAREDRLVFVNPRTVELTGYSRDELTSMSFLAFVHPEDRERVAADHRRGLENDTGSTFESTFRIVTKTGEVRSLELRAVAIDWEGLPATLNFLTDITARRRAERALLRSEREKTAILASMNEMVAYYDETLTVQWCNRASAESVGQSIGELLGRHCYEIWHGREDACPGCPVKEALEQGEPRSAEVQTPDGRRWELRGYPVTDENGEVIGAVEVGRDITVESVAREKLAASEARFRSLVGSMSDIIFTLDIEGRHIGLYGNWVQQYGLSEEMFLGKRATEIMPPEQARVHEEAVELILAGAPRADYEWHNEINGETLYFKTTLAPLRDAAGEMTGVVGVGRDVTAETRALNALQQSEERYRRYIDEAPEAVFISNAEGRYLRVNRAARRMTGYNEQELLSLNVGEMLAEESELAGRELYERVRREGRGEQVLAVTDKDDGRHWWKVSAVRLSEKRLLSFAVDITERVEAERALEQRYRYERALARCSRALLSEDDPADALRAALAPLLRACDAGRVYVFENVSDDEVGLCMSQRYEVCAPGIEPQLGNSELKKLAYADGFTRWRDTLRRGDVVRGLTEDFPASEKLILQTQEIKSILVLPLFVGGGWWGFVGFDDCVLPRRWEDDDVQLLRTAAEMISSYFERRRVTAVLAESEQKFRTMSEQSLLGVAILQDDTLVYVNESLARIVGMKQGELAGAPAERLSELIHPDDRPWMEEQLRRKQIGHTDVKLHSTYRIHNTAGELRWIDQYSKTINYLGRPADFVSLIDITERKRAQEIIRNTAEGVSGVTGTEFFNTLVGYLAEALGVAYVFIGLLEEREEGEFIQTRAFSNHGEIGETFDYQLEGTPCSHVIRDNTLCAYPEGVSRLFPEDHDLVKMNVESYIGAPLYDSEGRGLGLMVVMDEEPMERPEFYASILRIFAMRVSTELERSRAEEALRESERLLNEAQEIGSLGSYIWDVTTDKLQWSRNMYRLAGLDPADFSANLSVVSQRIIHPADRERVAAEVAGMVERGEARPMQFRIIRPDGEVRIWRSISRAVCDDEGRLLRYIGVHHDITEQQRTLEALNRELEITRGLSELYSPLISPEIGTKEITAAVLDKALELTGSSHGYVSEIEPETGIMLSHTLTEMMPDCDLDLERRAFAFPPGPDGEYQGLWGHALNERKPFYTNTPEKHPASGGGPPQGHVPVERFLAYPVQVGDELLGQIALANADHEYGEADLEVIGRLAEFYALALQRKRFELALTEQEAKLDQMLQTLAEGVVMVDDSGEIVYANQAAEEILELQEDSILGHFYQSRSWNQVDGDGQPHDPEELPLAVALREERRVKNLEHGIVAESGETKWLSVSAAPLRDTLGKLYGAVASFHDVTVRRLAEEQTRSYIDELQLINETAVELSRAADVETILDILGDKLSTLYPESYLLLTLADAADGEIYIRRHYGFHGLIGKVVNILGNDPRKLGFRPEEMSPRERELYTTGHLARMAEGLYTIGAGKFPRGLTRRVESLLAVESVYAMGFTLGDRPFGGLVLLYTGAGEPPNRFASEAIFKQASFLIRRRWAEQALAASEERFHRMADSIQDGLTIIEGDEVVYTNRRVEEIFGWPAEKLESGGIFEIAEPQERERLKEAQQTAREGQPPEKLEFWINTAEGDRRCVQNRYSYENTHRPGDRYVVTTDITEQKLNQEAILRSKREWERTFDSVPDLITILDDAFRITRANRATAERFQLSPVEVVGQHCYRLFHDTQQPVKECPHVRMLAAGEERLGEEKIGNEDYLISVSPLTDEDGQMIGAVHVARDITELKRTRERYRVLSAQFEAVLNSLTDRVVFVDTAMKVVWTNRTVEHWLGTPMEELRGKNVHELWDGAGDCDICVITEALETGLAQHGNRREGDRRLEIVAFPVMDGEELIGVIEVMRDITDRLESQEAAQRQLMVEQVEQIFSSIRHEIGNALNTLKTTISVLRSNFDSFSEDKRRRYFQRIFDTFKVAERLLMTMKEYQKFDELHLELIQIDRFLREKSGLLVDNAKNHGVELRMKCQAPHALVQADRDALVRVLLNVVDNAINAARDREQGIIEIINRTSKDWVIISVTDNGLGIAAKDLPHVMTPLYTTKPEGSGLGLSIVEKLIQQMGGLVSLESVEGEGTRVTFRLPFYHS